MTSAKSRSYKVRREIPVGSRVVFLEGADNDAYMADDQGTVLDYTNAGDMGIVARVRLDDGTELSFVPAGILATP